jgi:hypothetical protein
VGGMAVAGPPLSRFSFPTFPHRARKDGAPGYLAGVRLRDTRSLGCARDDRLFRVCTGGDARACADWRSLVQRSFVGSRVCATPLPQDDGGRLASPWAFSRVSASILGGDWPCPVSEMDGVRWSRFSVPTFPHGTRKDGAPDTDWRRLVQRSFVGSRVCATPLPQDDSGRLAYPWAFSRVGSSISGSARPHPISEADGVRWSRFSVPTFPQRTRKDGAPGYLAGVRLRSTGSLGCARDDRFVRGCTNEDARARTDWRGLVQRSFVGSRVCATPLPQDDGGRLACPWVFSRVGSSISGGDWPCPVSEMDGVRWSRFSVPTFPHRTRKDWAAGKKILLLGEAGTAYLSA